MASVSDTIFYDRQFRGIDDDTEFIVWWTAQGLEQQYVVKHKEPTQRYATFMSYGAKLFRLSPFVLSNQFRHETASGNSQGDGAGWIDGRNPAGIGIYGPGATTPWTPGPYNAEELAAYIHVVEMWVRSTGSSAWILQSPTPTDFVRRVGEHFRHSRTADEVRQIERICQMVVDRDWNHLSRVLALFRNYPGALTSTLSSLRARFGPNDSECAWACDPYYDIKMVGWLNRGLQAYQDRAGQPPAPGVDPTMDRLTPVVLLLAGHRQTVGGGGTPGESVRTPNLVKAYQTALNELGVRNIWVQAADGDSDPDDTVGGLDVTSAKASQLGQRLIQEGNFVVLLDLHFEGTAASVRGLFSIYPRSNGLTTGAPVGNQGADAEGRNGWDKVFGARLAKSLSKATGIPLRSTNVVEPGLMGEHQTGVGGDGYRLATFAYTVPLQDNGIRLVVEHGALTNTQDKAIIDGPGYYANVTKGVKEAFAATFATAESPNPPPPPPDEEPGVPLGGSAPTTYGKVSIFNGATWYPLSIQLPAGPNGARGKRNAGKDTPVAYTYPAGELVRIDWLVHGQGGTWHYVTRDRLRVPITDFDVQYVLQRELS